MKNNSIRNSDGLADALKNSLLKDKKLQLSIRAQSTGFLEIFIRDGVIQKIKYCEFKLQSSDFTDENEEWSGIELPEIVYHRFCILIADALASVGSAIDYGSIRIDYTFEENENSEWLSNFEMAKLNEIHFDKYGHRRH